MSKTRYPTLLKLLLTAAACVLAVSLIAPAFFSEFMATELQYQLTTAASSIPLNASFDTTEAVLRETLSASQKIEKLADSEWHIKNPSRFGATNWILVLVFEDGRLIGRGIRTADSLRRRPPNSIPDEVAPSYAPDWKLRFKVLDPKTRQ